MFLKEIDVGLALLRDENLPRQKSAAENFSPLLRLWPPYYIMRDME